MRRTYRPAGSRLAQPTINMLPFDFDLRALYDALDEQRASRNLTWRAVAEEVNCRRTRLRPGSHCRVHHDEPEEQGGCGGASLAPVEPGLEAALRQAVGDAARVLMRPIDRAAYASDASSSIRRGIPRTWPRRRGHPRRTWVALGTDRALVQGPAHGAVDVAVTTADLNLHPVFIRFSLRDGVSGSLAAASLE